MYSASSASRGAARRLFPGLARLWSAPVPFVLWGALLSLSLALVLRSPDVRASQGDERLKGWEACPSFFRAPPEEEPESSSKLWHTDYGYVLLHSGPYREVRSLRLEGLRLLGVAERDGELGALVELGPGFEDPDCARGTYFLPAGSTLGPEGRLLKIRPDFVLVRWRGAPRQWVSRLHTGAAVQLVWRSLWVIAKPPRPTRGTTRSSRRSTSRRRGRRGRR